MATLSVSLPVKLVGATALALVAAHTLTIAVAVGTRASTGVLVSVLLAVLVGVAEARRSIGGTFGFSAVADRDFVLGHIGALHANGIFAVDLNDEPVTALGGAIRGAVALRVHVGVVVAVAANSFQATIGGEADAFLGFLRDAGLSQSVTSESEQEESSELHGVLWWIRERERERRRRKAEEN